MERPESGLEANFDRVAQAYVAQFAAAHPGTATAWGIHEHDRALADMSQAGIQTRATQVEAMLAEVTAIDRSKLRGDRYHDHRLVEYALRAELLELREIRMWQRNPMAYSFMISAGISTLVDRAFAPIGERMEALIARLGAIPDTIAAARSNLRDVPEVWARIGLATTRGTVSFLRTDLMAALEDQGLAGVDAARVQRFQAARERAVTEMERYVQWLESEVLPDAKGDYRLGAELLRRKLLYEEHIDIPLEALREMNETAIREYKKWVERVAAQIDPNKHPSAVMAAITSEYPAPDKLLTTARQYTDVTRRFVHSRGLLTLPSDAVPIVRRTPRYRRTGFASMSVPGPFEKNATEAYYNITPVDPAWDAAKADQHMTYFNFPGLLGITVHEAFPGHFVQLLYLPQLATDVRKVISPDTLVEGWAHYTEQMMVDEGLGEGDPKIRLGQLRRALQRHARWYAALALHAFDVPLEQVVDRFQEIAYFAEFPAQRETERGTYNPTYLHYALGRMQILQLRDEYRKHVEASGKTFSLRDFHDRFLRLGLPASLAREEFLPSTAR